MMNAREFCQAAGIEVGSVLYNEIMALPHENFEVLAVIVDPHVDRVIHVDSEGFSVNFGDVGTAGIRVGFSN